MSKQARRSAVAVLGAVPLLLLASGTASAAEAPTVSATGEVGAITVTFDFTAVDRAASTVSCVTYVVPPRAGLDVVYPSGQLIRQSTDRPFSVVSNSTSSAGYVEHGTVRRAAPLEIGRGTYHVFWGCEDAHGTQWENILAGASVRYTMPIVVTVPSS